MQEIKRIVLLGSLLAIAGGMVSCEQNEPAKQSVAQSQTAATENKTEKKVVKREIPSPVPLVYRDESAFHPALADTAAASQDSVVVPESSETVATSSSIESSSSEKVVVKNSPLVESSSSSAPPAPVFCENAPEEMLCDKRDGHLYRLVHIGNQIWMGQNLNYATHGSYCYEDKHENCKVFGRLYTWTSAMALDKSYATASAADVIEKEHRGACPEGFHMPKDADFNTLVSYMKNNNRFPNERSGTALKMAFSWKYSEEWPAGTDRFGFGAMASGFRNAQGVFRELGHDADFWVAEESNNPSHAPYWNLYYDNDEFLGDYSKKKTYAYSVRCLKNKAADDKPHTEPNPEAEKAPEDSTAE